FGESLIQIGERLAANRDSAHLNQPNTSGAVVSPVSASVRALPASTTPVPPRMTVPVPTSIPAHSEIPVRESASPSQQIQQRATALRHKPGGSPAKPPELIPTSTPPTKPVSQEGGLAASVPASAEPASVSAVSTLIPPSSSATADRGVAPAQSELSVVAHDG